ncbi:MAG: methyltransferase domain-containing protein, partial [Saprospiraceae bacterium]
EEWLRGKIKEFVYGNKRIDKCLKLLGTQIEDGCKIDICEVGCSIGLTSYQIARTYQFVNIHGYDISDEQINFANKVFKSERIKFYAHDFMSSLSEKYDIVTLFDVFEHVPVADRKKFAMNIGIMLKDRGKIIMTVPSHFLTTHNKNSRQNLLQVIDEEVRLVDLINFADSTNTILSHYELVSIWNRHDYAHVIFDNYKPLSDLDFNPVSKVGILQKIKVKLGIDPFKMNIEEKRDLIAEKTGIRV